ncbi:hypothetical protein, partial [Thiolapillus sp.]|uniref:hypothetical protein n=1 Tax=Thiolapillus sp. TaxID=2017437 RepID=UPI003AF876F8
VGIGKALFEELRETFSHWLKYSDLSSRPPMLSPGKDPLVQVKKYTFRSGKAGLVGYAVLVSG